MSKHIELLDDLKDWSQDRLISFIGQLLTVTENVAFAYDITEPYCEDVGECLTDNYVNFVVIEEDI